MNCHTFPNSFEKSNAETASNNAIKIIIKLKIKIETTTNTFFKTLFDLPYFQKLKFATLEKNTY